MLLLFEQKKIKLSNKQQPGLKTLG